MPSRGSHLTDQELLQAADGELQPSRAAQTAAHLSQCWPCRARKQELENAIGQFVRFHRGRLDPFLPDSAGPRALLKARLSEMTITGKLRSNHRSLGLQSAAAAIMLALMAATWSYHSALSRVTRPQPSLTPGAVATVDRDQVCDSARPKNRAVPVSLARRVFQEYGLTGAEPRSYEVDYLITPALGGAEDIRNLWPQSYSASTWNAQVKDALEDHLRDLVCSGQLDLATAQHDISSDWIAAYRKYFHTDRPLETAR